MLWRICNTLFSSVCKCLLQQWTISILIGGLWRMATSRWSRINAKTNQIPAILFVLILNIRATIDARADVYALI